MKTQEQIKRRIKKLTAQVEALQQSISEAEGDDVWDIEIWNSEVHNLYSQINGLEWVLKS